MESWSGVLESHSPNWHYAFFLSVQDHYCLRFEKEMVSLGYIYHRSGSVLVILWSLLRNVFRGTVPTVWYNLLFILFSILNKFPLWRCLNFCYTVIGINAVYWSLIWHVYNLILIRHKLLENNFVVLHVKVKLYEDFHSCLILNEHT